MIRPLFAGRFYAVTAALLFAALLGIKNVLATEWVKETSDFLISRDFKPFKIVRLTPVFFDT
jgi:hypothetical protein